MSVFTTPGRRRRARRPCTHVVAVGATPPPADDGHVAPSGMHGGDAAQGRGVPDGRTMQVTIPESIEGGMVFQVQSGRPSPSRSRPSAAAPVAAVKSPCPRRPRAHGPRRRRTSRPGQAGAAAARGRCASATAVRPAGRGRTRRARTRARRDSFRCQRCRRRNPLASSETRHGQAGPNRARVGGERGVPGGLVSRAAARRLGVRLCIGGGSVSPSACRHVHGRTSWYVVRRPLGAFFDMR